MHVESSKEGVLELLDVSVLSKQLRRKYFGQFREDLFCVLSKTLRG